MKIKVVVKNEQSEVTNQGTFDSVEDAQSWIDVNESSPGSWPDPHTVEQTDITAEYEQSESDRLAIDRGLAKQQVGARAVAMLNQVHEEMNLDVGGLTALVADQRLMMAVTLVRNGAIIIGRDMFLSVAADHYSAEQIERIVRPINESEFNVPAPT